MLETTWRWLIWTYYVFTIINSPGFVIITPSFSSFIVVLSNQMFSNCNCPVDIWFVNFSSDYFYGNRVFMINIEFCCHLICSCSMVFNVRQSLSLCFGFRPLFLLAADVSPWFVYAVITLETAALETPKKWPILLEMLQLNAQQKSLLFENLTSLQFCTTVIRTVTKYNL